MENPHALKHLGYLDGLRALAAVYVVLCHAFLEVNWRLQPLGNLAKILLQCFFFAHYAVDLFIVLSGFCLMLPVVRRNGELSGGAWRFFKRRAWRILPPYYAALALSLLLIWLLIGQKTGTHWDIALPVTPKAIWTHLILLQDVLGNEATINHVFWSISVEWRIYFLFPLLVFIWPKFGSVVTTLAALLLSYAGYVFFSDHFGNPFAAHYVGLFALGMLGANVAHPTDKAATWLAWLPWAWITALLSIVLFLMFFPRTWGGPLFHVYVADYITGFWSMSLLVLASRNEQSWVTKILSLRPLVFVGTFAYSIYLIHAPLLQVLWQYLFVPLHNQPLWLFAALTLLGTPLILAVSYAFFLVAECPFLNTGKPTGGGALAAAAALQPAP